MLTENDWQQTLDVCEPAERSALLLVFADWLEERGDERAAGYREMGRQGLCPDPHFNETGWLDNDGLKCVWEWWTPEAHVEERCCRLPHVWFGAIQSKWVYAPGTQASSKDFAIRREADDAAAIAFHKLSLVDSPPLVT